MMVTVHDCRLPQVEYHGQRMVTFDMIDRVHRRKKGTAAAAFRRNRHRFIPGRHYVELTSEGIRRMSQGTAFPVRTARGILVTEMGYLLLVKSFNDDLSWQIQERLVAGYFRAVPQFPALHHVAVPDMQQLARMLLAEAQHAVARAELESFREHGQRGSQSMTLRRKEKKALTPALAQVWVWSQPRLTGFDAACGEDNA